MFGYFAGYLVAYCHLTFLLLLLAYVCRLADSGALLVRSHGRLCSSRRATVSDNVNVCYCTPSVRLVYSLLVRAAQGGILIQRWTVKSRTATCDGWRVYFPSCLGQRAPQVELSAKSRVKPVPLIHVRNRPRLIDQTYTKRRQR